MELFNQFKMTGITTSKMSLNAPEDEKKCRAAQGVYFKTQTQCFGSDHEMEGWLSADMEGM
jgi:hypothetical protein